MADSPLERMLRALNHPVRRQVVRELLAGEGSATTISRKLGLSLGVVSYHLNQVLAGECDIVELVDSVQRRGAIEKIYRMKLHTLSTADPKAVVGAPGAPRRMSLEECFIVAVAMDDS